MRKFLILFAFISSFLFFVPLNGNAEQYLCISELSTGFSYNETSKSWERTIFEAGKKYIISKSDDGVHKLTKLGNGGALANCDNDFGVYGFLSCKTLGLEFRFNKINGRFLYVYPYGYYNVLPKINKRTDKNSDTPFMEIGKCSPF